MASYWPLQSERVPGQELQVPGDGRLRVLDVAADVALEVSTSTYT